MVDSGFFHRSSTPPAVEVSLETCSEQFEFQTRTRGTNTALIVDDRTRPRCARRARQRISNALEVTFSNN